MRSIRTTQHWECMQNCMACVYVCVGVHVPAVHMRAIYLPQRSDLQQRDSRSGGW